MKQQRGHGAGRRENPRGNRSEGRSSQGRPRPGRGNGSGSSEVRSAGPARSRSAERGDFDDDKARRRSTHVDLAGEVALMDEDELVAAVEKDSRALVLVLDCVQDPHNLGACLRSANAAGALAVVMPKDKSAPLSETARRVACGAAEHTPVVRVTNLARAMKRLQEAGMWLVGTSDQATQSLYQTDLRGRIGLVLGAEGEGMRRLTTESCDFLCVLPMRGQVECLNVSVATGVCLFEALRQREALAS